MLLTQSPSTVELSQEVGGSNYKQLVTEFPVTVQVRDRVSPGFTRLGPDSWSVRSDSTPENEGRYGEFFSSHIQAPTSRKTPQNSHPGLLPLESKGSTASPRCRQNGDLHIQPMVDRDFFFQDQGWFVYVSQGLYKRLSQGDTDFWVPLLAGGSYWIWHYCFGIEHCRSVLCFVAFHRMVLCREASLNPFCPRHI